MATTTTANGAKTTARVVVRLSPESERACRAYAKQEGCTVGEAADELIATGVKRLKALKRFNAKKAAEEKAAAKAAPKGRKGVTLKSTPASKRDDSEE